MNDEKGTVIFSHGRDSGPEANKIVALRPVVERRGWRAEAVDDRDLDNDPVARRDRLRERIESLDGTTVLVGSSLGGWVSMAAAESHEVAGLFLIAPALFLEHLHPGGQPREAYRPLCEDIVVAHGWRDDVIPWQHSLRFAERRGCALHLYDAGHRMESVVEGLAALLDGMLGRLEARAGASRQRTHGP
ncbi:MAG: YqiA/YcfP family alpha/beta fold hydrolase [Wenzhouxiangellaceae bacterium]|nr:YqiA/YcfP family alpha/beta fold hydrolase [Wenzhouxiangellaceae bacterium]